MAGFSTAPAVGDSASAANEDNLISNEIITDSGSISITPTALNTSTSGVVTFSKTFPSTPKVFVTVNTTGPNVLMASATGETTTGATVWLVRASGTITATAVKWFAVLTK